MDIPIAYCRHKSKNNIAQQEWHSNDIGDKGPRHSDMVWRGNSISIVERVNVPQMSWLLLSLLHGRRLAALRRAVVGLPQVLVGWLTGQPAYWRDCNALAWLCSAPQIVSLTLCASFRFRGT